MSGWRLSETQFKVKLNNPGVLDLNRKGDIAYVELGTPGVPHAVARYDGDLWADADCIWDHMMQLRHDPAFPKGANVNFHQWVGENEVRILTFERAEKMVQVVANHLVNGNVVAEYTIGATTK